LKLDLGQNIDPSSPEGKMVVLMFLIGRVLVLKLLLDPANANLGVQLNDVQKSNLKLFGSYLYYALLT
jgi:hypothetical protein